MTESISSPAARARLRSLGEVSREESRTLRRVMLRCFDGFPTYARIFAEAGVDRRALLFDDPLALLRKLPPIGADELADISFEALATDVAMVDTETSSATTGGKKIRFISYRDDIAEHEFLARLLSVCGVGETDRVACVDTDPVAVMVSFPKACELLGAAESYCISTGAGFARALPVLARLEPTVLISVPSIIERMLDAAPPGRLPALESIRKVVCIGEGLGEGLRARIQSGFGAEAFSYYGSSETSALGIECPAHDGIHLFRSRHIFELEDSDSEDCRLVVTTLMQEGLPLLRYRLGDVVRVCGGSCACALDEPRVDVIGRSEMMASILGSKIHHKAIHDTIQRIGMTGPLQILLDLDGQTEVMRLRVSESNARLADSAMDALLGDHADVEFLFASGLLDIRFEMLPSSRLPQERKPNTLVDLRHARECARSGQA